LVIQKSLFDGIVGGGFFCMFAITTSSKTGAMKKILIVLLLFLSITIKAQWQPTSGPQGNGGANVGCLLADGTDLYAGTQEEIYFTSDSGNSWTLDSTGFHLSFNQTKGVSDLVILGNNVIAVQGQDIYRSFIGSHNYLKVGTLDNPFLAVIGNILFGGILGGGVYMSTDSGVSWVRRANGITNNYIISIIAKGSNLYAGSAGSGVYFSSDIGTTWTSAGLDSMDINILDYRGNNLYTGVYGGNDGLFLSTDDGANWTDISMGLNSYQRWVHAIAFSGNNIFIGTEGEGVLVSNNNGASWRTVNIGLTDSVISSFAVIGNNLFAGTRSGVFRTNINELIGIKEVELKFSTNKHLPQPRPHHLHHLYQSAIINCQLSIVNL
jgi:hypothetical protein